MNAALAAVNRISPDHWWDQFGALLDRIRPRFARYEPARHAGALMLGLLSGLDRKNCWTIAEHRGDVTPDGLQHLLSRAKWDADEVRDDLRDYVAEAFGHVDGVFIADETGDLKKGTQTVGVQRQYTGTAGRIENAQVAVYLTYVGERGHAMIDRALYVPQSWAQDPERSAQAGIPQGVQFATKSELALKMITAAVAAGMPGSWVTADEVYGNDSKLRAGLEEQSLGYVLAVSCSHVISTGAGRFRADELARMFPALSWQVRSAGRGSKGPRLYSWAVTQIIDDEPGFRWLLMRRNDTTGELAFYRCFAPRLVPLRQFIRVAGRRWKVEESFQTAKGQAGLDEHQVRRWRSWHRWVTLSMLAMAFLAVTTAAEKEQLSQPALIPLTLNELRRLFDALVIGRTATHEQILRWSTWRRNTQYRAKICHYRRRSQPPKPDLRL